MRNWRDIDTLPQNTDDGWSARDGWVEKAIIGKNAVEKLIKYWHPFSDWTVASPETPHIYLCLILKF